MTTLIITVLGDDRAGLVDVLSGVIAERNGSWVRSHMAELAGKFAGVVEVKVPDSVTDDVIAELDELEQAGHLHIVVEKAEQVGEQSEMQVVDLVLVGQDHPGIVHEISHALAAKNVSIDELETETTAAPQGGYLFRARARLELPADVSLADLEESLEAIAQDLMIDLDFAPSVT